MFLRVTFDESFTWLIPEKRSQKFELWFSDSVAKVSTLHEGIIVENQFVDASFDINGWVRNKVRIYKGSRYYLIPTMGYEVRLNGKGIILGEIILLEEGEVTLIERDERNRCINKTVIYYDGKNEPEFDYIQEFEEDYEKDSVEY